MADEGFAEVVAGELDPKMMCVCGSRLCIHNIRLIVDVAEPLIREIVAKDIEDLPINHTSPWRKIPTGMTTFLRRDAYLRAARVARGEQ